MVSNSSNTLMALAGDWAGEIATVVLMIILLPLGRRIFFSFIHLILLLEGLRLILQPEAAAKLITVNSKFDSIHFYLLRTGGVVYIIQALTFWLIDRSGDQKAMTALMRAYTLNLAASIFPCGYLFLVNPASPDIKLKSEIMRTLFIARILGTLGCLYFVVKSPAAEHPKSREFQRSVLLDYAFLLVSGLTLLILPQGIIYLAQYMGNVGLQFDFFHDYVARNSGAMYINLGLMSHYTMSLPRHDSGVKGRILYPHLLFHLCMVVLNVSLSPDWTLSSSSWIPLTVKAVPHLCLSLNVYLSVSENNKKETDSKVKKFK